MPSVDEILSQKGVEEEILEERFVPESEEVLESQRPNIDLSFLTAKTGEGSLADYKEHPLNFNNSIPMCRVLRGLTGMFNSLDYALVDILVGVFEMWKGRRTVAE